MNIFELIESKADELPRQAAHAQGRSCGKCHACCVSLNVSELEKPMGTPCRNLTKLGRCGIYADRPATCSDYLCAWRLGADMKRPDKARFILDIEIVQFQEVGYAYVVRAVFKGEPSDKKATEARLVANKFAGYWQALTGSRPAIFKAVWPGDPGFVRPLSGDSGDVARAQAFMDQVRKENEE